MANTQAIESSTTIQATSAELSRSARSPETIPVCSVTQRPKGSPQTKTSSPTTMLRGQPTGVSRTRRLAKPTSTAERTPRTTIRTSASTVEPSSTSRVRAPP
jgi:hypothetical protein